METITINEKEYEVPDEVARYIKNIISERDAWKTTVTNTLKKLKTIRENEEFELNMFKILTKGEKNHGS